MKCNLSEQKTFWLVFELGRFIKPHLAEAVEANHLTPQQFHVLGYLQMNQEPQTMSDLASVLFCDASNITGIIDRMTTLRLVERVEHPKDRRVKLIRVTAKGLQLHAKITETLSAFTEEHMSRVLTQQEKEELRRILVKLLGNELT